MNILVTGASGFIASQIVTDLIAAGHAVTCCVRNTFYTKNLFPTTKIIHCDFIHDITASHWLERLHNIDVVINCVGVLYHPNSKIVWNIHYDAPAALFDACVTCKIKKIIQISALGVDKYGTHYANSKKAADEYLLGLPIPSIILRPSLVYGRGSYGSTSLFRGLAGLPWVTPLPGKGTQEFQPIHVQDLSKAIIKLIDKPLDHNIVLSAVSETRISIKDILIKMRAWLGFPKSIVLLIPVWIIRLGSFLGDLIPYSVMNSTSYKMLLQSNITSTEEVKKFQDHIGFVPSDFIAGIHRQPSAVQDHWHARLYFLRPLLQLSIAFVWLFTAACCLLFNPISTSYALLAKAGVNVFWRPILFYGASMIDLAVGIAMLCHIQLKKVCVFQIMLIVMYSVIITWKLPYLWFDQFAPLAKNVPLVVAILVFMALESER